MIAKQDGFQFAYSIRQIPDKGWGVFAEEAIKKGSIVWRYTPGQFVVYDEPMFKALIASLVQDEIVYELTHSFGIRDFPNCVIRVFDAGVLLNHATAATLATNYAAQDCVKLDEDSPEYIQQVTQALLWDRYAMIAVRDIDIGEEFTNNYDLEVYDPPFFQAIYDQYDIDDSYLEAP